MRPAKPASIAAASIVILVLSGGAARADGGVRESHVTAVGLHNTYDKAAYPYLADGLDSGAGLVELDVWVLAGPARWRVSHDLPLIGPQYGQLNNCMSGGLRTGTSNQVFDVCLDNLRLWHDQHPGHRPIVVKVELKNGFDVQAGASATDFDNLVRARLGDAVFTPRDLLGDYPTLDAAARADHWPGQAELAGKFLFEIIPGTFERQNPFDHLPTDVEYGRHLRDTPQTAMAFPAVLDAQAGDPRTRYAETDIRPWFVLFDGAATAYLSGGMDTSWYDSNHYFLVMTGAELVVPTLNSRSPDPAAAAQRVTDLARAHASIVSTGWYGAGSVDAMRVDRG
jgi:Phosphoinositide phospholipase C, Ca2+-dependent